MASTGTVFELALKERNVDTVRSVVQSVPTESLSKALLSAVLNNSEEIVKLLLDNGADVDIQDEEGRTALYKTIRQDRTELSKLLIQHGCNVNISKRNQSNALHFASKKGCLKTIEVLLDANCDINQANWGGNTALLIACRFGHKHVAMKLLEKNARVDICNRLGHYPLHYAAFYDDLELAQVLLKHGADFNCRTYLGVTPLMLACERRNCPVVSYFAGQVDTDIHDYIYGGIALHWAVNNGCEHCVSDLLQHCAYIDSTDFSGRTPLLQAIQSCKPAILKIILEHCNISPFSPNSFALHLASFLGDIDSVKVLLDSDKFKYFVELKDSFGDTPLDLALQQGHKEVAVQLMMHGGTFRVNRDILSGASDLGSFTSLPIKHDSYECLVSNILNIIQSMQKSNSESKGVHVFKTYSPIKMGMIDLLKSAEQTQMIAPEGFDFDSWMDRGPEAFNLKVTNLQMTEWLREHKHTPLCLRELCRGYFRKILGYRASEKVSYLPIPKSLKDYLNLRELGELQKETIKIRSTKSHLRLDIE